MTGFVYAIVDEANRVKIGWSSDPARRRGEIQTNCRTRATLVGVIPATKLQENETKILFAPWRIQGEWYHLEGPVLAFVNMLPPPIQRVKTNTHILCHWRKSQRPQLTQEKLAKLLNVARETVARWETGMRRVDEDKLLQISKITGIAPAQLRPDLAYLMAKVQRADVSDPPF